MGQVIQPDSTLLLKATSTQCRRIALQCMRLGIKYPHEERVSNRREARDLIWELRGKIKAKKKARK